MCRMAGGACWAGVVAAGRLSRLSVVSTARVRHGSHSTTLHRLQDHHDQGIGQGSDERGETQQPEGQLGLEHAQGASHLRLLAQQDLHVAGHGQKELGVIGALPFQRALHGAHRLGHIGGGAAGGKHVQRFLDQLTTLQEAQRVGQFGVQGAAVA